MKTNYMKLVILLLFTLSLHSVTAQELHTTDKDLPCLNKVFQVHAHVFLDSLGVANFTPDDLRADIEGANEAFAPICVGFNLCGIDTIINYEYDSLGTQIEGDEVQNIYHVNNRINIYLHTELQTPAICGFASLAGVALADDGAVHLKCQGTTLIHELGHLFGLLHTFEDSGAELVNGSNCETVGDGICDTPADPFIPGAPITWTDGCEFIYEGTDLNGEFYSPDTGNYMSQYTGCECGFTRGQYIFMAETYLSNPVQW